MYVWTPSSSFSWRLLQANPKCQRTQGIHECILGRQFQASEASFVYPNVMASNLQEACLPNVQTWNPLLRDEPRIRDLDQLASSMEMGHRMENQHGKRRMDGGHDQTCRRRSKETRELRADVSGRPRRIPSSHGSSSNQGRWCVNQNHRAPFLHASNGAVSLRLRRPQFYRCRTSSISCS